jgi:DNA-binding MarR family transcriptional regulator
MSTQKTKLSRQESQDKQLDLPMRAADLSFFLMFSAEIQRGLVARLGASAFSVWIVLRSFARVVDGRVYQSLSDLHRTTGMSVNTIRNAISKLEEEKLVQVVTDGKQRRRYFVVDLVPFKTLRGDAALTEALEALDKGENDGTVALRYVPKTNQRDRQEVEHWLKGGLAPSSPNVQLVGSQTVVHQHVEHQHVHLHVHPTEEGSSGKMPDFIERALQRARGVSQARTAASTEEKVVVVTPSRNPVSG